MTVGPTVASQRGPRVRDARWAGRARSIVVDHRSIDLPDLEFLLTTDYIALNQLLKLTGVCDSGGAGKALVAAGQVCVDGNPESRKTAKIRAGQVVCCGDSRIVVRSAEGEPSDGRSSWNSELDDHRELAEPALGQAIPVGRVEGLPDQGSGR